MTDALDAPPPYTDGRVSAAIIQVLTLPIIPVEAADGDCLEWADRITKALHARNVPAAESVWVTGKDPDGAIIFMHKATRVYSLIIDVTATQFSPKLPPRWLAEEPNYIEAFVRETGAAVVEVSPVNP